MIILEDGIPSNYFRLCDLTENKMKHLLSSWRNLPRLSTTEFNLRSLETGQHAIPRTARLLDWIRGSHWIPTTLHGVTFQNVALLSVFIMLNVYLWSLFYYVGISIREREEYAYEWCEVRQIYHCVRFEVFTAVTITNIVFWDVALCRSCVNRRFGGTSVHTRSTPCHIPEDGILQI
jgi:hypothetical protein